MHSRYGFIPSRFPKDLCRAMCICVKLCMVWLCQTWFGKHFGSEFSEFSSLWGCCWGSVESRVGSSFQVTCICFKWELNKTIFPIPKKNVSVFFDVSSMAQKMRFFKKSTADIALLMPSGRLPWLLSWRTARPLLTPLSWNQPKSWNDLKAFQPWQFHWQQKRFRIGSLGMNGRIQHDVSICIHLRQNL